MRNWLFAALALVVSMQAQAVDGYKDLKFGMTKQEIQKKKPCTLFPGTGAPAGAESLECVDYSFVGSRVRAGFFFINGKFERIGMMIDAAQAAGLMNSLVSKYGPPSSASTQEQFSTVDTTPGASAYAGFDNNTIYLRIMADKAMNKTAVLIYTSPDYNDKIAKHQSAAIDSDI